MRQALLALLLVVSIPTLCLTGCGSSPGGPSEPIASEQQVENMVKARSIFDASDKNWDNLPADKKDEYTKLVGAKDQAGGKSWWDKMGQPLGGGAGPSGG
ncbi:hypothetical protein EON81_14130 [bacterium]|nr:MAG: hypothetical protein EON81_14130 [bacterium]